jgi:hypothetical protein
MFSQVLSTADTTLRTLNVCITYGGEEQRGRGRQRRGSSGAGDSFPTAGIMVERRPLAPFLHGFMGALPHGDGIHGEAKTWLWWLQIRGWRGLPRARVPPFI